MAPIGPCLRVALGRVASPPPGPRARPESSGARLRDWWAPCASPGVGVTASSPRPAKPAVVDGTNRSAARSARYNARRRAGARSQNNLNEASKKRCRAPPRRPDRRRHRAPTRNALRHPTRAVVARPPSCRSQLRRPATAASPCLRVGHWLKNADGTHPRLQTPASPNPHPIHATTTKARPTKF